MLLDPLGLELGKDTAKVICLCLTMCRPHLEVALMTRAAIIWRLCQSYFSCLRTQTGSSEWLDAQVDGSIEVGLLRTVTEEGHGCPWLSWWVGCKEMVWESSEGWLECFHIAWASLQQGGFMAGEHYTGQFMAPRASVLQSKNCMTFYDVPSEVS